VIEVLVSLCGHVGRQDTTTTWRLALWWLCRDATIIWFEDFFSMSIEVDHDNLLDWLGMGDRKEIF
jgi:hypothetical protein